MSEHAHRDDKDRVVGKISFQFLMGGKQVWSTGEYETYVHPGEEAEEAMARAEDRALDVAFDLRDAFVSREKRSSKESRA